MWWHTVTVDCVWNVMAHVQKPDFVFRRYGRVHLHQRGCQFSRLLAAEVCASAVVMLDTPRSEVVWRVLATLSIRQFPLHFPSFASPCAIRFQKHSTTTRRYSKVTIILRNKSIRLEILDIGTSILSSAWNILFCLHIYNQYENISAISLALETYVSGIQALSYAWASMFYLGKYSKYKPVYGLSFTPLLFNDDSIYIT